MWKNYSAGYLKNNRSSCLSVMIAAFISALLLSLLCGLFYNAWKYEIERIVLEEGGWQSRITGTLDKEDLDFIRNFATVKDAVINPKESQGKETAVDLYFYDCTNVLKDTLQIAGLVGISPEAADYHHELLAMYLIRDPRDPSPRLVFPIFLLITAAASVSLIIIIHNSFAVTMNARIHQFGILSSIGATPKQIRTCLLQEAAALCAAPILIGNLSGMAVSMALIKMANALLGSGVSGRHEAVFGYHPLVLAVTLLVTLLTIGISAWLPARKLSRLTPLQAIQDTEELQLKRRKNSSVLALLFGMEGLLAGNALKAQRKALRTSTLSLIFSFLAFTVMQCFFTISGISTRETYFERYLNVWDVMVTVKDTEVDSFRKTEEIQELPGVRSAAVYQRAAAERVITEDEMSEAMKSFGGFSHASDQSVTRTEGGWLVNAPIVILDDASFLSYCGQLGIEPRLDGAVIRNRIRDVTNPDFRHPRYVPYVKGESGTSVLSQSGRAEMAVEIPVLSYAEEVPALREEYATLDYYELVHFVPASLWKEIKGRVGGAQEDSHICILGREGVSLEELEALQRQIEQLAAGTYQVETENRIQKKEANDRQIQGMMTVLGCFCVLLAVIGIGSMFSNTLGFVRQRRREFARYLSVGMAPAEIRKMFWIEALVIAGRPVLFTLPLSLLAVWYFLRASYLEAELFLAEAPFLPITGFLLVIWTAVALAYYLGWRNVRSIHLADVLRDDTMM